MALNVNFFLTPVDSAAMSNLLTAVDGALTDPIDNVNLLDESAISGATCPCFLQDVVTP